MQASPPGPGASLADWLAWQERLHPQAIELGLERVAQVASRLGLPAAGIRTVTVAGTNGKGSTTAMLASIYKAAGYSTGSYSSPHLLRYNERVVINGSEASDAQLCDAFAQVERARGATTLTYFEFGTLAALVLFARQRVQVQVLEVGLGGRLDAVNLVDADVAVITNIGLDHGELLGTTREQVAVEKAGILRRGRPAVYVDADPCARVLAEAARVGAPLQRLGHDFRFEAVGDNWNWVGERRRYRKLPAPALPGRVQLQNAAGVVAAVEAGSAWLPVPEPAIRAGLAAVRLAGRLQRCGPVLLDVAHNAEAAAVLAAQLAASGEGRMALVLGMLAGKPVAEFLRHLAPHLSHVHAATLPGPRGLPASELLPAVHAAGLPGSVHASPAQAYEAARAGLREGDTMLVCGSFLTVAAILPLLK